MQTTKGIAENGARGSLCCESVNGGGHYTK
jgi:hypothetical protein